MFRTPISITDLYVGSVCISLVLVAGTISSGTHPIVTLIALFTPLSFVTLRLVLLSKEYTEENLVKMTSDVYFSFLAIGVLTAILVGFVTYSAWSTIWVGIIFAFTTFIARQLHNTIGLTYDSVDFGFRSSLPESELWESGIVCLQNGRNSTEGIWKSIWYWLASQRFKTLTYKTSPDDLYSNHHIANGYYALTSSLAQKFFPHINSKASNISEVELDSILVDFTQQECFRCGRHYPVSKLYILTNDGTVSEMYCEDCIEQQQPSASAKSRTNFDKDQRKDESETAQNKQKTKSKRKQQTEDKKTNTRQGRRRTRTEKTTTSEEKSQTTDENTPDISSEFAEALQVFSITYDEFEMMDDSALKQQYRELVQDTHPDSGGDAEEFKEVVDAYQFLQKKLE